MGDSITENKRSKKPKRPKQTASRTAPVTTPFPNSNNMTPTFMWASAGTIAAVAGSFWWLWKRRKKIKSQPIRSHSYSNSPPQSLQQETPSQSPAARSQLIAKETPKKAGEKKITDQEPLWAAGKDGENKFKELARDNGLIVLPISQEKGGDFKQLQVDGQMNRKRPDFEIRRTLYEIEVKTYVPRDVDGKPTPIGDFYFLDYYELGGLSRFQNDEREKANPPKPTYAVILAVFAKNGSEAKKDSLKMIRLDSIVRLIKDGEGDKLSKAEGSRAKYIEVQFGNGENKKGYLVPKDMMKFQFGDFTSHDPGA